LPAICIDARHAKAALDMAANKTDANDADGLAQLAEVGFFRAVRVKGKHADPHACSSAHTVLAPAARHHQKPNCSSGASCLMTTYQLASPHSNSIVRPACDKCGTRMRLVGIEDERLGYELGSFECPKCHHFKRRSGKPQRKNFFGLPAPIYDQLRSIDKGQPHALPDPSGALKRFRGVNI
jgi:hypothetical protein